MTNERVCPRCGNALRWRPGVKPERIYGYCECNLRGPVVVTSGTLIPDFLLSIPGIDTEIARAMRASGLHTREALLLAEDIEILSIAGIGPSRLEQIREFLKQEES